MRLGSWGYRMQPKFQRPRTRSGHGRAGIYCSFHIHNAQLVRRQRLPLEQASGRQALGPLSAAAPKGWVAQQPSSSMRVAQYGLPGPDGEATLGIFFFGPGQGGSVEANIERWHGQFTQGDGQPAQGRRWTRQVGDIEITGLDISGTFSAGMGMGDTDAPS